MMASSKKPTSQKAKRTRQEKKKSSNVQTLSTHDPVCNIVHGLLIQRDGTWVRVGDQDQNAKAAWPCFVEWKLFLGSKFRGALVFQDADYLTSFFQSEISLDSLESLGGFKVLNLSNVGENRLFDSLNKSNTFFLLTVPLLEAIHSRAVTMRCGGKKDTSGLVTLWRPMHVVILVRNPSKITVSKIDRRSTKPCCASLSSLMGLVGLLREGKEMRLDEKSCMEAQKVLKRFDI